ncbi:MAG: polysaccharide biosynthesis protein [Anaerostipes sp.]|jgi:stage V sporulation protein B|nr:polysaccharide biosynthesis protein [Anaerostipes sp.]MDD3746461.1 polysaccharide biosynthesis protein [Anaerostipes sp.]
MSKKQKNGFLIQGSIMAIASLVCRVIGLLYRRPLTAIIGDQGMGYYGFAYNVYSIILLIASFSIPLAVSKSISARLAMKEYKNAQRIFYGALIYAVIVGGIAALFAYIAAPVLIPNQPGAILALRVMAPTIFFSGILGVLRGYFQGHSTMVPTSISQIIEQILNAVVSVLMAYVLAMPYLNLEATKTVKFNIAKYGAAGSALGTGAGVLIGLLFCLIIYLAYSKRAKAYMRHDKTKEVESYSKIFKILLLTITPVIFSTAIYNCSAIIDSTLFNIILSYKNVAAHEAAVLYGVFSNQYNVLINVPVALASALSNAIVPDISGAYVLNDKDKMNHSINTAIRFTMMISIPCAVGMGVLAKPLVGLLFGPIKSFGLGPNLLRIGSISIVFYCLSTLTNGILQGMGKMRVPVRHSVISVILNLITIVLLLLFTNTNAYALVFATMIFSFAMCILNARSIKKYTSYKQELSKTFIKPCISALIMGIVVFAIQFVFNHMMAATSLAFALCIVVSMAVGALIYFVCIIKLQVFTESELLEVPKGSILVRFAKKFKLL